MLVPQSLTIVSALHFTKGRKKSHILRYYFIFYAP